MQAWLANLGSSFRPDVREVPRTLSGVADAVSFLFPLFLTVSCYLLDS